MDKLEFQRRLAWLRTQKGVSARDMSLSLGQSAGYINNIENGISLPSMAVFFYICDYLGISPKDFFDISANDPSKINILTDICKDLSDEQIDHIIALASDLRK